MKEKTNLEVVDNHREIDQKVKNYLRALAFNPNNPYGDKLEGYGEAYRKELEWLNDKPIEKADSGFELVRKVSYFAYNYSYHFLLKAFAHNPNIANHFQSKFSHFYNQAGNGEHAFIRLFTVMNAGYQKTLVDWIDTNFKWTKTT